jgi:hypothetical protein
MLLQVEELGHPDTFVALGTLSMVEIVICCTVMNSLLGIWDSCCLAISPLSLLLSFAHSVVIFIQDAAYCLAQFSP